MINAHRRTLERLISNLTGLAATEQGKQKFVQHGKLSPY
jgi:hypothetical protein